MPNEHKQELHKKLWSIANDLRGNMDANSFKDYILGFIFYKYLSEKFYSFANKQLASRNLDYKNLSINKEEDKKLIDAIQKAALSDFGYYLNPSDLFLVIAERGNRGNSSDDNFILGDLGRILNHIGQSTMGTDSEDDFSNLFESINLASNNLGKTEKDKNELIAKVLHHLSEIDFKIDETEIDVLGDAYEYLISQFASGAGKKAGEFYTPQTVSTILAKIVTTGKDKIASAYDPTCGSGSLLLRVKKEVGNNVHELVGQEMVTTTYNLARMNMILHDVHFSEFDIKNDDTLRRPQHLGKTFEAVVANPPFSAKWSASAEFETDERFAEYGRLAPVSKADYAFITHMIHHLSDNGIMAVVMPHGALFRGSAEGVIRRHIIEKQNYLDAVIGLPANIFYGTSIPTSILVFRKDRNKSDDVLFIDASGDDCFEKGKNQNNLREQDIQKIVDTYKNRTEIERYSHKATLDEIAENDYNLNIPRYVDTFEPEPEIDLNKVAQNIQNIESDMQSVDEKIAGFCDELGINNPFK
jgi:type I restriction enzyme M protein